MNRESFYDDEKKIPVAENACCTPQRSPCQPTLRRKFVHCSIKCSYQSPMWLTLFYVRSDANIFLRDLQTCGVYDRFKIRRVHLIFSPLL